MKPGRNDPCPCGSGKKHKKCCCDKLEARSAFQLRQQETEDTAYGMPSQQEMSALASLYNQQRYREAELLARSMTSSFPHGMHGWQALGAVLKKMGRNEDALVPMRKVASLFPNYHEAHYNLGNTLNDMGRLVEAEASYRRALQIKPDYVKVHINLGNTLQGLSQLAEAEACYRRALQLDPDYVEAHNNLGSVLLSMGRSDEAEACCRRALQLKPDYAEAHNNLGSVLLSMGRSDEAEVCYRHALKLDQDYVEAHNNLGKILLGMGRTAEAEACYRHALKLKPDYAEVHSNLIFTLDMNAGMGISDLHDERKKWVDLHEYLVQPHNWELACVPALDRLEARQKVFRCHPLAGRRLRVGYVSGDYRQHPVSYFIEQLFAHHDRTRIELFAYSNHIQSDTVTERLQTLVEHWIPIAGIPDAAVRERIEADGIDVLIDLSGHTGHNRLGVFARRAAPVQAHYLGYFASTGLTEMDYWIGDEILTPPETDSHFSERVWRLPRVWVSYDGKVDAPVSNWHPSQDGVVWLGSFNNLGKLTPATLALWAKVLHALPESKLLLKAKELSNIGTRQRILDAMSGHGVSSDRIELQDSNSMPDWSAHMAYYNRLDIALDPVGGVGGGTTTCDALWMGVPVITLEGDRMASRMTASMLNAIGRPEWIAHTEAEYIDKVVVLARDVEQRKALRPSQRNRVSSSPLCNAKDLALNLESAYFEMFERRLAGKIDIEKLMQNKQGSNNFC